MKWSGVYPAASPAGTAGGLSTLLLLACPIIEDMLVLRRLFLGDIGFDGDDKPRELDEGEVDGEVVKWVVGDV